jgi:hypothetical protein
MKYNSLVGGGLMDEIRQTLPNFHPTETAMRRLLGDVFATTDRELLKLPAYAKVGGGS